MITDDSIGLPCGVPDHVLADNVNRTHRQRTQNYIKTLESEVIRLRESETNLFAEREGLLGQIESLKTAVSGANLPLPPGVPSTEPNTAQDQILADFNMPATISYSGNDVEPARLHVEWPSQFSLPDQTFGQDVHPSHSFPRHEQFGTFQDVSHGSPGPMDPDYAFS